MLTFCKLQVSVMEKHTSNIVILRKSFYLPVCLPAQSQPAIQFCQPVSTSTYIPNMYNVFFNFNFFFWNRERERAVGGGEGEKES